MSANLRPQNKKEFVILLLILGGIIAIGPLTIDVYLPAFNAITDDFQCSERLIQLSLTSYFLGITFGQISYGPIVDRFGKKPPLFFGLILFAAASLGCFYSTNIEQLIALRFLQALGACACTVIPRAIVRDIFSPQESARVFSHLILVMGVAPIMAPLVGNLLLEQFGWRSIFFFLAVFSVFCLLLTYFAIPETKGADEKEKISDALRKYWGILHDRNFVASSLTGGLMMAGLFAFVTGSPAIYLDFFELSSRDFGLIFSLNSIGFVCASQINARLLKKFSIDQLFKKIILLPLLIGSLLLIYSADQNFWVITSLFFAFLFSCGMIFPNTTALALANHAVHSGSASALLGTIQFGLAACASFLIGRLDCGGVQATILIVGSCGILAFVTQQILKERRHSRILNESVDR